MRKHLPVLNINMVVIVLLIIFFTLLFVYLYNRAHDSGDGTGTQQQLGDVETQLKDFERIKEEIGFVPHDDQEVEKQMQDIDELRIGP